MIHPPPEAVPGELVRARELLARFDRPWALTGGWALDGWLGRVTRSHADVDLSIWLDDQQALRDFLRDGWLLNGHDPNDDDSTHDWDGHRLEFPGHIHARAEGFELDIQLNLRDGEDWLFRREPRITLPISRVVVQGPWDMPALAPVAILYYKGHAEVRPHDDADFGLALPLLSRADRSWLAGVLAQLRADHPWLLDLVGSG